MINLKYLKFIGCLGVLFYACKKDDTSSNPPSISLISVQPIDVQEFTDSIVFTIAYDDLDGDIGFPNADTMSLWLKDARLTNPDAFFIPPLAPLDQQVHISGEFNIILPNTFRLGTGPQEQTSFEIWIKDRAGNLSNRVETPLITINQ
jgi:hypothetical protein